MRLETQPTADLARLGALLEDMPVAMLTTVGPDGALLGCPMEAIEMDGDGAIWFFTDLRSDLGERLRSSHLSFADDKRGTYVSLSGRGEIAKDTGRVERLWTLFDKAGFPEGPNDRHLGLLKFVPDRAEYWDAPSSRAVRLIALAATAVSGTPVGQAEHDVLSELTSSPRAVTPRR